MKTLLFAKAAVEMLAGLAFALISEQSVFILLGVRWMHPEPAPFACLARQYWQSESHAGWPVRTVQEFLSQL